MKIALIVIGVIAIAGVAFEIVGSIIAKRAKSRFDKMSPEEQRRHQEQMYKRQQMG